MRGAYKIGRFAGIDVKIHWSFLILLVWIFFSYLGPTRDNFSQALWGTVFILLIFGCVLLHEFGHALTARRYGIPTRDIILLPIGGVANLERIPERPMSEMVVALAGPAVNFVIAGILYLYLAGSGQLVAMPPLTEEGLILSPEFMVYNLFGANLLLAVFNLIPAFPMDGGRVLRALLAMQWSRPKATRLAAGVGRVLAVAFIFLAFFGGNFWLAFIGIFIYLGASAESRYVSTKSALSDYRVSDITMSQYTPLNLSDSLGRAVNLLLDSQQKEFVVLDEDGIVAGMLTRELLIKGLHQGGEDLKVSQLELIPPLTLFVDQPLEEAYDLMMSTRSTVSPVYRGEHLVGLLNQENVQEFLLVRQRDIRADEDDIYLSEEEADEAEEAAARRRAEA